MPNRTRPPALNLLTRCGKIRFCDKNRALETLAKHLGLLD